MWSSYNDIAKLDKGFQHSQVNHTFNFVAPVRVLVDGKETKVHTNGIESDWNACKARFKYMRGKSVN
jgi:hypothetical protein